MIILHHLLYLDVTLIQVGPEKLKVSDREVSVLHDPPCPVLAGPGQGKAWRGKSGTTKLSISHFISSLSKQIASCLPAGFRVSEWPAWHSGGPPWGLGPSGLLGPWGVLSVWRLVFLEIFFPCFLEESCPRLFSLLFFYIVCQPDVGLTGLFF